MATKSTVATTGLVRARDTKAGKENSILNAVPVTFAIGAFTFLSFEVFRFIG